MNSCLETFLPEIHGESSLYTHNPFENSIARKHSQQKKWLDYILISKKHKEPLQDSYVFTFPLTCPSFFKINKLPFPIPKWCSPYYHSFDLSDHYPVLCHIETQP